MQGDSDKFSRHGRRGRPWVGLCLCCLLRVVQAGGGDGEARGGLWIDSHRPWDRGDAGFSLALEDRHVSLFDRYALDRGVSAFSAGVNRRIGRSLSLDAGLAVGPLESPWRVDYRDYFLGVRYGGLAGRVWYRPDPRTGLTDYYYEAGWRGEFSQRFSFSLDLGQRYHSESGFASWLPDLSVGARARFGSLGLGLRLVERGGERPFSPDNLRLMGNISASFH